MRSVILLACCAAFLPLSTRASAQAAKADSADPYVWLEDINGARAMEWVKAENAKTAAVLEKDPRWEGIYKASLAMAQAKDRLTYVNYIGGELYNFWEDSEHVRGIWRKTTLESFRTASPKWTTVLDLDALAKAEKANWVFHGYTCQQPAEKRCLIDLSDGGEDASTIREFDLATRSFVKDGFYLPKGKQRVAWTSQDTILVAREWNPGEVTSSGYAYIVKKLARGKQLTDAVEIFRGSAKDGGYGVSPQTLVDAAGHRFSFIIRPTSTFEAEHYIVRPKDVARLAIPPKGNLSELIGGQVIVHLYENWKNGSSTIREGSVAAFDGNTALKTPDALAPVIVFEPGAREAVQGVSATKDKLLIGIMENVKGRVLVATRGPNGSWSHTTMSLPDNVSTNVVGTNPKTNEAFISVTGFLTPSSIWMADAARGTASQLKTLAPRFNASNAVVEQMEATSKDGTKIPYFIVHPKSMARDGANPTILYAYGGFNASMTPNYDADVGKLWVEQGGVYVLANIRGGGEFGPAWHEAGLKTNRQRIYDDFAAVAQDLIAKKITSTRRLGIQGGSNGGLLMGVQFTQHPELWNAVDIQVPLLDMLRFEKIQAGASWVGEYGSVSNPDERAFLAGISPYNNLKPGVKYPTPLIWTTTKDDRVGPQHARKFAAKMAAMGLPYYFFEVIEGGHGSGANIEQQVHTTALEYTYFAKQLMDENRKFVP